MSVRAKFQCDNKTMDGTVGVVHLHAVISGSEENESFWRYTPAGELSLHIDNPAALDQFEMGKEYYLDITEAPPSRT